MSLDQVLFSSRETSPVYPPEDARHQFNVDWLTGVPSGPKQRPLRVYCIAYARENNDGRATSFANYRHEERNIAQCNLKQAPRAMIQMIQAFQTAVTCANLQPKAKAGTEDSAKKDKQSAGGGKKSGASVDPEQKKLEKKERKKEQKKAALAGRKETFTIEGQGNFNRVDVGIEDIKDLQGLVIGWRLWYFLIDDKMDPSSALVKLFWENEKKAKMPSVKQRIYDRENPSLEGAMVTSTKEWIEQIIQYYQPGDNPTRLNRNPTTLHEPITSHKNPAHIDYHLNFYKSCDVIDHVMPTADPRYSDDSYYTSDQTSLRFPEGIFMLYNGDRAPAVLHHALLIEDSRTRDKLNAAHTIPQRDRMIETVQMQCINQNRMFANGDTDAVGYCRMLNMESHRTAIAVGGTQKEIRKRLKQVREGSTAVNRINGLFASYTELDPGHAATVQWLEEQKMECNSLKKAPWSAMRLNHVPMDSSMSLFAHYFTRCLSLWENVVGFGTCHQEMQLINVWRMTAFDSRKKTLFPHLMLYGPAETGKSNLQKWLMVFTPEGGFRAVDYDTARAYTDDKKYNSQVFVYDEMPDSMLKKGEGGQGDPLMKSVLSNGKTKTTQMEINPETKRREAKEYECQINAPFMVNTNVVEADMPEPIASRFFTHETMKFTRKEVDFLLKDEEMRANPENEGDSDAVTEEMKLLVSLVACVELLIKAGALPQVNQTAALLRWNLIKGDLAKDGITLASRKDSHIMSIVRAATLMSAVLHVFFTTDIFPAGKAFEYADLLKVAPFLMSTEEHLIWTITSSEHCITDSNSDDVLLALQDLCRIGPKEYKKYHYKEGAAEGCVGTHDYMFFVIELQAIEGRTDEVLQHLAVMVTERIKRLLKKTYLPRAVESVLRKMSNATMDGFQHYTPIDGMQPRARVLKEGSDSKTVDGKEAHRGASHARTANMEPEPLMEKIPDSVLKISAVQDTFRVLDMYVSPGSRAYIYLNRDYIMGRETRGQGFLMSAIEKTQDKYTPARRLLTGKTYRDNTNMVPYVYQTFDAKPNYDKPCRVLNLSYRSPGSEHMFATSGAVSSLMPWDDPQGFYAKYIADAGKKFKDGEDVGWVMWQGDNKPKPKSKLAEEVIHADKRMRIQQEEEEDEDETDEDEENTEPDRVPDRHARYLVLPENMDTFYYKKFLKENYLLQPKRTRDIFPVCMSWVVDTATYPGDILAKARYEIMGHTAQMQAFFDGMSKEEQEQWKEDFDSDRLEAYYIRKQQEEEWEEGDDPLPPMVEPVDLLAQYLELKTQRLKNGGSTNEEMEQMVGLMSASAAPAPNTTTTTTTTSRRSSEENADLGNDD